jgi:hypothetical protein
MQLRFIDIKLYFPYTSLAANYVVVFLACYVLGRVLFGHLRPRLPYFSKVQKMLDEYDQTAKRMDSFADLANDPKS